jgi:hypothetical protein
MFLRAVNAAYGAQAAWDLLNQYRSMHSSVKESNLSKSLTNARERIEGYIEEATRVDEDEDQEGDEV